MIIDNKKLREIYVPRVKLPFGVRCEHFYAVPGASGYALSDHGRLYKQVKHGGYNVVHPTYSVKLKTETYKIRYDGNKNVTEIAIHKLMAQVFYPHLSHVYLYRFKSVWNPAQRWSIYELHVLNDQAEYLEAITAKLERREPNYDDSKKGCTFINRFDPGGDFRNVIERTRKNMLSRSNNTKFKARFPEYKNCTCDPQFKKSSSMFGQWFLDNHYAYPGKLELDKDILGFGEADCYTPEYMCLIPKYLNLIFTKSDSNLGYSIQEKDHVDGTKFYRVGGAAFTFNGVTPDGKSCDTYAEALTVARKMKSEYLRRIVAKERADGFIPEHILTAIEKWASLCELGLIKKWEPAALNVLAKEVI